MASAVNEVASLLGLPTSNQPGSDDLKSPEQHQASMFAARQAQQKGDQATVPSFSRQASPGVKKVATIKPQFKTLSKKSTFQTPFMKKEDELKKLSPQKQPVNKNIEKLRSPSSPKFERRLPTVSSRYHSPSLKRQRGRQVDSESFHSDDEHKKLTSPTKNSPSSVQKPVKQPSKITSPKAKITSPKMSPKMLSPKRSPKLSPIPGNTSVNQETASLTNTPTKITQNTSQQQESSNLFTDHQHSATSSPSLFSQCDLKDTLDIAVNEQATKIGELLATQIVDQEKEQRCTYTLEHENTNISKISEDRSNISSQRNDKDDVRVDESYCGIDHKKLENKDEELPTTKGISHNSDELETLEKGDVAKTAKTLSENYDHINREKKIEKDKMVADETMVETEQVNKSEKIDKSEDEDSNKEKIIECLLTPQEEQLNLSIEMVEIEPELDSSSPKKKSRKRKSQKPLITTSDTTPDEADRQKVNDFFHQKFGITFSPTSTPKGADRPKPLLKFSRKDGSDTERFKDDYSPSGKSPGKFKSTFKALGSSPEKMCGTGGEKGNKGGGSGTKGKTVEKEDSLLKKMPAKRKIERSPVASNEHNKKTKNVTHKRSTTAVKRKLHSSTSSHSSSESSDTERVCSATVGPVKKSGRGATTSSRYTNTKQANKIDNRKRKKVYSSSSSSTTTSDTEDEFSFTKNTTNDITNGLWVQCEKCDKWRYLRDMTDPTLLPSVWICSYNPDKKYNNCNAAEEHWTDLDNGYEFVYDAYSLGSLVWCKMQGYPWWPGMIDNDPSTKTFYYKHANSQLPDKYHVTFFGKQATRAWISNKFIKVYNPDDKEDKYDQRKSSKGMREAVAMANQAFYLELNDRHKIYGFKELCKSEEYEAATSSTKSKGKPGIKINKKRPKSHHGYLVDAALAKLSPSSRSTHSFPESSKSQGSHHTSKSHHTVSYKLGRGRGRPRKNSVDTKEKNKPAKKTNKRAKLDHPKKHTLLQLEAELDERDSYIPAPNTDSTRLNNLNVIENIEHEINQVLRDCSPSPTRL